MCVHVHVWFRTSDLCICTCSGNDASHFAISGGSYVVTTEVFDYETTSSYPAVTITVTDNAGNVATATLAISVNNLNDNVPACTASAVFVSVAEGTTAGELSD